MDELADLAAALSEADEETLAALVADLPDAAVHALLAATAAARVGEALPPDPAAQAQQLDPTYVLTAHVAYLARLLAAAVADVERGENRHLLVMMPPRMGKSTLVSLYLILWLLRRHPTWPYVITSHDGGLATGFGRAIQRVILDRPDLGIALERYPSAASEWATTAGGSVLSRGVRGSLTGRGARVLVVDDPVKDYVDAHSPIVREALWNWWLTVALGRLEPPYLVLVVMTRWHEDDFAGRLLSKDHEGDPSDWQVIRLPALAESREGEPDALERSADEPLLSPLLADETPQAARARWRSVKRAVGSYVWASTYQQRPAPARGAIFDAGWWHYWTSDPSKATQDGRVLYLDPSALLGATWLDSWDAAFKGTDSSDFVVGQRWCRKGADRFLLAQVRGRWSFTTTLESMRRWSDPASRFGSHVHLRLIEDKANGPAIIDTLRHEIAGLVAVSPEISKEARARAITPECESGNVFLPHPSDPGNEWVADLLSELRNFPHDANDDQVDALTQALLRLRAPGRGQVTVPGSLAGATRAWNGPRNIASAARSDLERKRA